MTDNEIIKVLECSAQFQRRCDEQIIKALECCAQLQQRCDECPDRYELNLCGLALKSQALKLINRQKAEIEELREIVFMDRSEAIKQLKAEAVKEFAEMLKATAIGRVAWDCDDEAIEGFVAVDEFDNLVKEFTGDNGEAHEV